jgi:hypothetical protein
MRIHSNVMKFVGCNTGKEDLRNSYLRVFVYTVRGFHSSNNTVISATRVSFCTISEAGQQDFPREGLRRASLCNRPCIYLDYKCFNLNTVFPGV